MYRWLSREFTTVECYINESRNNLWMTKIGHDEAVTTNREIVANHLNVSIFHHILSSRRNGSVNNSRDHILMYDCIINTFVLIPYDYIWYTTNQRNNCGYKIK